MAGGVWRSLFSVFFVAAAPSLLCWHKPFLRAGVYFSLVGGPLVFIINLTPRPPSLTGKGELADDGSLPFPPVGGRGRGMGVSNAAEKFTTKLKCTCYSTLCKEKP